MATTSERASSGPTGLVWDNHACLPLRADDSFLPQLARYRTAGVDVVSVNVGMANMPSSECIRVLSFMRKWLGQRPHEYALPSVVDELLRCRQDRRLAVIFDIEGMDPVEDNPALVQTFYELGVRWMLIAYNLNNRAGGGCLDVDGGLTAMGRAIIDEMERVGMVLCLSHTGERTAADALEYSRNPVIFSHSNPRGHTPHPRNVSDALIRACARKGGVVGLSGIGLYLGAATDLVSRLMDQLRYVIDLVGPAHVGLGLDYVFDRAELDEHVRSHPHLFPVGIAGTGLAMIEPERIGEIANELSRIGLTDEQVRGVMGENWLRIATQVWRSVRE